MTSIKATNMRPTPIFTGQQVVPPLLKLKEVISPTIKDVGTAIKQVVPKTVPASSKAITSNIGLI